MVNQSNITYEVLDGKVVYYVAPDGNDANPGNLRRPFKTLQKTLKLVKPGDTVYVRGGTYYCDKSILFDKSGEEGKPIRVWAYKNEKPVFDFSKARNEGLIIKGAYWHLKGLMCQDAELNGVVVRTVNAHHNLIENIIACANGQTGILVEKGATDNLLLNCDAHHNYDPETNGQDADGFGGYWEIGQGNIFRGCRAWNNADDGYDFDTANNRVHVEACYTWQNGQNIWNHPLWEGNSNGFKFGSGTGEPILSHCVAWAHAYYGFKLSMQGAVYNCTAFRNLAGYSAHMNKETADQNVKNNISWPGSSPIRSQSYGEHNSWNEATGVTLTVDDFLSTDDRVITGPRNPDGSLSESDFLKLAPGSDAIDAGIDIGLPYTGKAPDLGAFEYASVNDEAGRSRLSQENPDKYDSKQTQVDPTLREAVEKGKLDTVKRLVEEGSVENRTLTALLYTAISWGDLSAVKYLVENGADMNADAPTPVPSKGQNYKELCGRLRPGATPENKYRWTPLHAAVSRGRPKIVEYLIVKGADINMKDDLEWTPLHVAAWQSPGMIPMLITNGADVHAKDFRGRTPLHYAAEQGHLDSVRSLIISGAGIHAADNYGSRPLHCAACEGHTDIVDLLIAHGAEVNSIDNVGRPPLYYAARWGHGSVVLLLMTKEANPNVADKWGWTPAHVAAWTFHKEAMEGLLIADVDLTLRNYRGRTALNLARTRCQQLCGRLANPKRIEYLQKAKAIVDLLIEHGAEFEVGQSELQTKSIQRLAAEGDVEHLKAFLNQGNDINSQDETGFYTALHVATMAGHMNVVDFLLANGANVGLFDRFHSTALHYAVEMGRRDIIELLIAKGADINARNKKGQTLLDLALSQNRKAIAELLIDKGADVNARNSEGRTALEIAMTRLRPQIAKLLVDNGADVSSIHLAAFVGDLVKVKAFIQKGSDVNTSDEYGRTALHYAATVDVAELLISKGADVHVEDKDGKTPLHTASAAGCSDIVELLVQKGADVNAKRSGYTPLSWAIWNKHRDVIKVLVTHGADVNFVGTNDSPFLHYTVWSNDMELVKLFVAHGARLDVKDDGWTVLHYAAEKGHKDILEYLVNKGADVNVRESKGQTPLQLAKENGHTEIVELLRKHGAKE